MTSNSQSAKAEKLFGSLSCEPFTSTWLWQVSSFICPLTYTCQSSTTSSVFLWSCWNLQSTGMNEVAVVRQDYTLHASHFWLWDCESSVKCRPPFCFHVWTDTNSLSLMSICSFSWGKISMALTCSWGVSMVCYSSLFLTTILAASSREWPNV